MIDYLAIPEFLDLSIPANLERWKEARKNWRDTRTSFGESKRKVYYDRHGRALPLSSDETTLAVLRQIEAAEIAAEKEAARERKENKKIERNARNAVKQKINQSK